MFNFNLNILLVIDILYLIEILTTYIFIERRFEDLYFLRFIIIIISNWIPWRKHLGTNITNFI